MSHWEGHLENIYYGWFNENMRTVFVSDLGMLWKKMEEKRPAMRPKAQL